ncbi:C2H2-type domain-containing protein [Plasmodiophora brassicae]
MPTNGGEGGDVTKPEKQFKCTLCSKRFYWAGSLTRHNRIHTGEKPFTCLVCHKRFTQSGTLNRHIRTHSEKDPFLCKHCPRRFPSYAVLSMHLAEHRKNNTAQVLYHGPHDLPDGESPPVVVIPEKKAMGVVAVFPDEPIEDMVVNMTVMNDADLRFCGHLDAVLPTAKSGGGEHAPLSFAFDSQLASKLEEVVNLDLDDMSAAVQPVVPSAAEHSKMMMLASASRSMGAYTGPAVEENTHDPMLAIIANVAFETTAEDYTAHV